MEGLTPSLLKMVPKPFHPSQFTAATDTSATEQRRILAKERKWIREGVITPFPSSRSDLQSHTEAYGNPAFLLGHVVSP